jgi:hypothetical protein
MHCSKVLKTNLLHVLCSHDGSASRVVSIGLCPHFRAKPGYARKSKTDAGNAAKGFVYNAAAAAPHYTYDLNGNFTQDKHKNLTLGYNYLNLITTFRICTGQLFLSINSITQYKFVMSLSNFAPVFCTAGRHDHHDLHRRRRKTDQSCRRHRQKLCLGH